VADLALEARDGDRTLGLHEAMQEGMVALGAVR